ncbi:NLP/P60 protein [Maridesulfovibrio salexigens DSM 2638]|uniref:NLP/P60 protein n=1 Tax=Maridesulfovibrio salexigens (strain ATCC 14822 / DSM 2638 / NCIMB 8403 / VKM B-1763) TaxID=526222 RepID=C6C282_MARSD|nr:NLP/P60 protein [Maridesulfovibrio salexigens DSM 2638]
MPIFQDRNYAMNRWEFVNNRILRLIIFCSLLVLISGCGKKVIGLPGADGGGRVSHSSLKSSVVKSARAQVGKPYKWGGSSPREGFDCSGLVWWVYHRHGISVPRVSWQQKGAGRAVSRNEIQAGDIVLFKIPGQSKSLHTGIYSGNGYSFIHSPKSGHKVREESMEKNYWRKYYIGARRVIN